MSDLDVLQEARERYAMWAQAAREAHEKWTAEGAPLLLRGPRGGLRRHPLLESARRLALHAHQLGETLARMERGGRIGRPPVAVMEPSPAKRLRGDA